MLGSAYLRGGVFPAQRCSGPRGDANNQIEPGADQLTF